MGADALTTNGLYFTVNRYIHGLYEVNIETAKSCHSNDKVCKYMIWKISGEQLYCKASVSSGAGCITKCMSLLFTDTVRL